jgi:hypothetical protein
MPENNNWFILKEDRHIGPFSSDDIYKMYHEKLLDDNSMLWQNGAKDWMKFQDWSELFSAVSFDIPVDRELPPAVPDSLKNKARLYESVDQLLVYPDLDDIKEMPELPLPPKNLENRLNEFIETQQLDKLYNLTDEEEESEVGQDSNSYLADDQNIFTNPVTPISPEQLLVPIDSNELDVPEEKLTEEIDLKVSTEDSDKLFHEEEVLAEYEENLEASIGPHQTTVPESDLEKYNFLKEVKHKNKFVPVVLTMLLLVSFIIVSFNMLIADGRDKIKYPQGYSDNKINKLNKVLQKKLIDGIDFRFVLADSGQKILSTSNYPNDYFINVQIESVARKVLSDSTIKFHSQGLLSGNTSELKNFNFYLGSKIQPGLYNINVSGRDLGLKGKIISQLQKFKIFNFIDAVKYYTPEFEYSNNFFLAHNNGPETIDKIKNYNKDLVQNLRIPVLNTIENVKTFITISNKILSLFKNAINTHSTKVRAKNLFESNYAKNIAPILQNMIVNNKLAKKVSVSSLEINISPEVTNDELFDYGKDISALTTKMTKSIMRRSRKKLTYSTKKSLISTYTTKVNALNQIGQGYIRVLKNQYKSIK